MFKLVDSLTFWWPVKVAEPDPSNPGKTVEHVFEAEFEIISNAEGKVSAKLRAAIVAEIGPEMTDEAFEAVQSRLEDHDLGAMRRLLKNWRKITSEDGTPIPFTPENLAAVWGHRRVQVALVRAYDEAITGEKGRLKN